MEKLHRAVLSLVLAFLVLTLFTGVKAAALKEQLFITIKINGQPVFTDTNPYIKQNRTFVPIRFIAESFNMEVLWEQEEKKATVKYDDLVLEVWIGSNKFLVNGEEKIMDVEVEGVNGRTMVPVRYFAEALDCSVDWNYMTASVEIIKEGAEIPASSIFHRSYTDEDIIWLARIVHVEGHGLSIRGKVAIANVVLNRVKSPDFPDTVYDVIFDKQHGKQFPPAHRESFPELIPDLSCVIAAKMALERINNIDNCLYFNHVPFHGKSKDLYMVIDGEYFYY